MYFSPPQVVEGTGFTISETVHNPSSAPQQAPSKTREPSGPNAGLKASVPSSAADTSSTGAPPAGMETAQISVSEFSSASGSERHCQAARGNLV